MRKILTIIIFIVAISGLGFATYYSGRGCDGSKNCHVCKNCKYCKHCAKEGGRCGTCK